MGFSPSKISPLSQNTPGNQLNVVLVTIIGSCEISIYNIYLEKKFLYIIYLGKKQNKTNLVKQFKTIDG